MPQPHTHTIGHCASLFSLLAILGGCASGTGGETTPPPGSSVSPEPSPGAKGRGSVVYGPISQAGYRLDSRDSLEMEMPDGSFQRTVTVKSAFLTVTLLERGEQLTANISLDSLILDRPNPILQPLVDSAQGIRWQGVVEKTGRLDSLTASRPSVLSEQVRAMLSRLWPILPDSGAAPGDQWESQATLPYQIMVGFEGREVRQARFRSAKWENVHGIRALTVHSTMEYTVSGSGSGFGQEIMVEGSGRAQGTHRISVAGVVIESEVDDSVKMMLTVPAVGQTVPTMVVTRYSLSPLP